MEISRNTRIIDLTIGEFEDWMKTMGFKPTAAPTATTQKRYVYGIVGIMELFNCCESTAIKLKNGKIKEACIQSPGCRKVVVDAEKALELYKS